MTEPVLPWYGAMLPETLQSFFKIHQTCLKVGLCAALVLLGACTGRDFARVTPPLDLYSGQVADLGRKEWQQVIVTSCRAGSNASKRHDCEEEGKVLLQADSAPAKIISTMCNEFSTTQGMAACYSQAIQMANHDALRRFRNSCSDVHPKPKAFVTCLRKGFQAF